MNGPRVKTDWISSGDATAHFTSDWIDTEGHSEIGLQFSWAAAAINHAFKLQGSYDKTNVFTLILDDADRVALSNATLDTATGIITVNTSSAGFAATKLRGLPPHIRLVSTRTSGGTATQLSGRYTLSGTL